jgi:cellulose synthase/poly-beta-1,6-N-acetylglucosamine synthase-like glycosyltransferase
LTAREKKHAGGGDLTVLTPTERAASQAEGLRVLPSIATPGETAAGAAPGLPVAEEYLPRPPTSAKKYGYFRHRRPYVFTWLLIAGAGIIYVYARVATKSWATSPPLVLPAVTAPPVVVNFWIRIGTPRVTLSGHHATTRAYQHGCETVDVFLPSCDEPVELLDNTLRSVLGLRWHGTRTVYVLGDSAREEVRTSAERYGCPYVVRANRGELMKARNLINVFGLSDGEFIVVLDADFAVRADFLYRTIPCLADPKIGIVQTVWQFSDTRDPSFSYIIQRYSGALQEIFFRFIQPSRDRYKAAICAGANRVHPRRAVKAVGGFARVPIGEDVHSGVKSWCIGYETWYVPLCLAKGVAPGDFASLESGGEDLVPRMVSRLRTWIVAEQALLWSSPALPVYQFGGRPYWAMLALGASQLDVLAPLNTCTAEHDQADPRRAAVTFLAGETALADAGHAWNVAAAGLCISGPDSFLTQQSRWFGRRNPARIAEGATR